MEGRSFMELLGTWRLKEMLWLAKGKFCKVSDVEIAAMEPCDENRDLKRMLEADFIISESSLDVFYRPREGEEELAAEKGWTETERGLLIEHFPWKIEDGVLLLDYTKKGLEYSPTWVDEEGVLALSGGLLKIQRA